MCNCGNTITTSSVCSSCVQNDCACPIKDLSTDCIQYTGDDLPCTEILGGTLMTEAFSQLDTYLCDLSTQLANSFSLISVGAGTRVYKGVDGIGRKEIRSITPTNTILTVGLSTDNKEVEIGIDTTVLGQFVQANQITYSMSNVGTGANVYKSSTQAGNNVTFNLRDIKSTDSRVTVTEGPTDIDITLSANLAEATGIVNYVSKFTGTHTLGNSQIFDNGTNVIIGATSAPLTGIKFYVYETGTPTIAAYFQNNNADCYTGYHSAGTFLNSVRVGAQGNNLVFSVSSDGTPNERMRVASNGNVGINNINPTSRLVVDGDINAADGIVSRNLNTGGSAYSFVGAFSNSGEGGIDLRSNPSTHSSWPSTSWLNSSSEKTNGLIVNQAGANPIRFFTNGSEKVRITPAGFVGIGLPTPTKILDVNGDILVNGLTVGRGGGNNNTNVAVGLLALENHNSGQSGHNVAVGFCAARRITTGQENMALGFGALEYNLTGSHNHAIGNGTLLYQTTDDSVGNGFLALAGVNGVNNTAMGTAAAWGDGNGFPGAPPVGTGSGNTAIGAGAIYNLTDGDYNTAVGTSALGVTNGSENVGIGFGAAGQNAASFGNIAIGSRAMYTSVFGDRNTVIGHFAMATDFSECVVLGAFANATGSNQFVVGSTTANAGAVTTETNTSTKVWNVVINGVAVKILLA